MLVRYFIKHIMMNYNLLYLYGRNKAYKRLMNNDNFTTLSN